LASYRQFASNNVEAMHHCDAARVPAPCCVDVRSAGCADE
jgi:hypothetical protein